MKARTRTLIIFPLIFALVCAQAARAQESALQGFDDYVNKAMREWEVPGLAIAIIKDDKILLAKGYGVRKLGDPTPVDEKTAFAIGSASKAFTAALAGMLVDEGKMKWDDPATKHLPDFQLFDPYASREMTVRDLLSHRSGLERGDLLWYGTTFNREEILHRVRYLKPSWSFRSYFGYQNIMYLAAGQAVAHASGKSWDQMVEQRIFKPLGMTSSNTSITALKTSDNVAMPHAKMDDKVEVIPWRNIDNIAPAGSINSTALDMAQWVRLQLGQGKYKNEQLLSSGAVKEMHMPHTIIRSEPPWSLLWPEAHFLTYGLGWFMHDYYGRKVIEHGGNIDGMSALVAMMPEENLGMVVLTNLNGTQLPHALMYRVFDSFVAALKLDWSAEMRKAIKALEAQAKAVEKKQLSERVQGTKPSLALNKYIGTYTSEMYGDAKVTEENGHLVMQYGGTIAGDLEHWHYDTFRAAIRDRQLGKPLINFTLNASGKPDEMKIWMSDALSIAFKRAPEKAEEVAGLSLSEAELRKFVGKYEMKTPPLEISIEMIAGKLKGVVPGQPVSTLVPVAPNRFKVVIEGVPVEIFAQFDMAEGKPRSMTIEQGGMKLALMPKQ
jgi:CubicO group peptidase (beta-lactamase class C family)